MFWIFHSLRKFRHPRGDVFFFNCIKEEDTNISCFISFIKVGGKRIDEWKVISYIIVHD